MPPCTNAGRNRERLVQGIDVFEIEGTRDRPPRVQIGRFAALNTLNRPHAQPRKLCELLLGPFAKLPVELDEGCKFARREQSSLLCLFSGASRSIRLCRESR